MPPPTTLHCKVDGFYAERGVADDARIPGVLDRMLRIALRVANALRLRGIVMCGARCLCDCDGELTSVDLRLRARRRWLALVELKWCRRSVRPAKGRALLKLNTFG